MGVGEGEGERVMPFKFERPNDISNLTIKPYLAVLQQGDTV